MTNPFFPQWVTANVVLENIVDKHFGLEVYGEGTEIHVSFFPTYITGIIPEEDCDMFLMIYNDFVQKLSSIIMLPSIFKEFEYHTNDLTTRVRMEEQIRQEIELFEAYSSCSIMDEFKGNLGIPGYRNGLRIRCTLMQNELEG